MVGDTQQLKPFRIQAMLGLSSVRSGQRNILQSQVFVPPLAADDCVQKWLSWNSCSGIPTALLDCWRFYALAAVRSWHRAKPKRCVSCCRGRSAALREEHAVLSR